MDRAVIHLPLENFPRYMHLLRGWHVVPPEGMLGLSRDIVLSITPSERGRRARSTPPATMSQQAPGLTQSVDQFVGCQLAMGHGAGPGACIY